MERRGSKHLRIAATLELLMGAALIAGTFLGIGADTEFGGLVGLDPSKVLFGVSGMYAVNAFKVLTGLLGIALANKKSFLIYHAALRVLPERERRSGDRSQCSAVGNPVLLFT